MILDININNIGNELQEIITVKQIIYLIG